MGSHIQPSRFLDSAVLSLFAMILSAAFLYMFSEFYIISIESKLFNNKISLILTRLFPFKKTFDYNLTHILLLTICIILLSLKPDYELYNISKPKKNKNKVDKKEDTEIQSQDSEDMDKKNTQKTNKNRSTAKLK